IAAMLGRGPPRSSRRRGGCRERSGPSSAHEGRPTLLRHRPGRTHIERLEAQLVAKGSEAARRRRGDTVGFVMPIAGGVASFAEAGSPMNKVAGLGFGGVPSADSLD